MIPLWIFIPTAALAAVGCFGWLRALLRAEEQVTRILDEELYQSPVPPLNPQKAQDTGESTTIMGESGSTLRGGPTDG